MRIFGWFVLTLTTVLSRANALSNDLMDIGNIAVRQSPSSTRFVTNKMCPFAQKAWIALEASDAPFEMEQISLYGPNGKPDWFWKLNPKGQVPVLVCQGGAMVLADSDLILDEIGTAVEGGSTIAPDDDATSSKASAFRTCLNEFLPIGKKAVLGGTKQKMWDKLQELDSLVEGPYVCGDQVTVADCAGFPLLWRISNEYGPLGGYGCQNLESWLSTCESNPAFAKTIQGSWWWWW